MTYEDKNMNTNGTNKMKAVVYTEYGPPEVLRLAEVEKPVPKDNEVLIRVHATTANTSDANMRGFTFVPNGFGFLPRLMFGIRAPKKPILGTVVAGEIEAVGKDVTRFKVGDRVFGSSSYDMGAYAEYLCLAEDGFLTTMPAGMTYEEAAAIPHGAHTALYFLRDKGQVQKGQKVLIIGASGSIGTNAVQLAKYYGAEVTGVCSGKNVELVKSLGADKVIDYTKEDFSKNGETYDIILDVVGTPFSDVENSLKQNGLYLAGSGGLREFVQMAWTSLIGDKKVIAGQAAEHPEDMAFLKELAEAKKIQPVIDRSYPLEQIVDAHRYLDTGHKSGMVVITI
jgi:NADPH:quinone reductase-like Zn-dependent oxidoreductase